jgi:hypothetical protein
MIRVCYVCHCGERGQEIEFFLGIDEQGEVTGIISLSDKTGIRQIAREVYHEEPVPIGELIARTAQRKAEEVIEIELTPTNNFSEVAKKNKKAIKKAKKHHERTKRAGVWHRFIAKAKELIGRT